MGSATSPGSLRASTYFTLSRDVPRTPPAPTASLRGRVIESCWSIGGEKAMERAKGKIARSSGNVFRDLGFGHEEAEHLLIRSELMIKIEKLLKVRGLTQSEAARIMRVSQPRVSDLLRGRLDLFSTDALIDMLARLALACGWRSPRRNRGRSPNHRG